MHAEDHGAELRASAEALLEQVEERLGVRRAEDDVDQKDVAQQVLLPIADQVLLRQHGAQGLRLALGDRHRHHPQHGGILTPSHL